jgi:4-carboxymuconolactone decarboxylase
MKNLLVAAASLSLIASAFAQVGSAQDAQAIKIMRNGSQPSRSGAAEYFTGSVRIDPLFEATDPSRASGASVTFAPAARTAWHSHALGQILIVTAGVGRVQRWGDPIDEIRKGDVVWIPPGQKHWHGASPNSAMTHIGVVKNPEGERTTWMEKVSDSHYDGAESSAAGAAGQPSRAQSF